jgi:hypothetical protein
MPYSNFTLKKVQQNFGIEIIETSGLFAKTEPKPISAHLQETLADNVSLAMAINTEKARSEFIIAPVLIEIRKLFDKQISLFSGSELTVAQERELTGFCDFIISQSPEQLFLKSPVITVVEAKNENIMSGLGQCAAEMIAARLFNEQENTPFNTLYGVVTSGNLWKFLKLENSILSIDLDDYGIKDICQIVGILCVMIATQ